MGHIKEEAMPDYAEMYRELFRATTRAISMLQQAQITTEEMFLSAEEPQLIVLKQNNAEDDLK